MPFVLPRENEYAACSNEVVAMIKPNRRSILDGTRMQRVLFAPRLLSSLTLRCELRANIVHQLSTRRTSFSFPKYLAPARHIIQKGRAAARALRIAHKINLAGQKQTLRMYLLPAAGK